MTRAKCITTIAMNLAIIYGGHADLWKDFEEEAIIIFDSLNGIVFVDPIEATEEMIEAYRSTPHNSSPAVRFHAMAATGDLTNPPEKKP